MSASTAGAVKARLEGGGLGLPFFRDRQPDGQGLPYGVVRDGLLVDSDRAGDEGDPDARPTVAELVQVDLWQAMRNPDGSVAEDDTLPGRVLVRLRGARLPVIGTAVTYGITRVSYVRIPDADGNTVHHAFSLTVHRQA